MDKFTKLIHSSLKLTAFLLLILVLSHTCCGQVSVCTTSCTDYDNINKAVSSGIASDTQLILQPGEHYLNIDSVLLLESMNNVSITGVLNDSVPPVLKCSPAVGLAFTRIETLILENLIIDGCGIGGQNYDSITRHFPEIFHNGDTLSSVLYNTVVALLLVDCHNISIENVTVRNTRGIGLLAMNLQGMNMVMSTFEGNKDVSCVSTACCSTGGGVSLLYQDYSTSYSHPNTSADYQGVAIADCVFVNNSDCCKNDGLESATECSSTLQEIGYTAGGGGGLTVMMSQLHFSVSVEVISSRFEGNVAKFGSGAHVGIFSGVTDSSITFTDCQFDRNGLQVEPYIGGAMAVFTDLVNPMEPVDIGCSTSSERNVSINVLNSTFTNNRADIAGGVYIHSLYVKNYAYIPMFVVFQECQFHGNVARKESALFVREKKVSGTDPGLQLKLDSCTFRDNQVTDGGGTVSSQAMNLTLSGKNTFSDNIGVGLSMTSSQVHVLSLTSLTLSNNYGLDYGGGLKLIDSFLVLQNNTAIYLTNNTAGIFGGGIYFDCNQNEITTVCSDCFLHLDRYFNNVSIYFQNNNAQLGSVVFGSTLESCPWISNPNNLNHSVYQHLYINKRLMFFEQEPNGTNVNTHVKWMDITKQDINYTVIPGQKFAVEVHAYDGFNNIVPAVITMTTTNLDTSVASSQCISCPPTIMNTASSISDVYVKVNGKQDSTVPLTVQTTDGRASTKFHVTLSHCLLGYYYNETKGSCYCDRRLAGIGVLCSVDSQTFTVPNSMWFGPLEDVQSDDADPIDDFERNNLLVFGYCPLDYCKTITVQVAKFGNDFNFQCTDGYSRTGLLCGTCKEGLSVTLGSSQCKKCSNSYLLLLILFTLFALLLIFGMAVCQITILNGYLNSVLFYSNVINFMATAFVTSGEDKWRWMFLPVGILSLQPALGVCVYDGMTSITYLAILYSYILLLYLLIAVSAILARFVKLTWISPVKALATLLILCYNITTEACVTTLAFVRVRTLDGNVHWRWYIDPTVHYFQGSHAVLCVVAIMVLLVYIIPVSLLALFPNRLYNIKFFSRLKPLYDVMWAPFKPRLRWWLGFRLLMRWIPFVVATFLHHISPTDAFIMLVFLAILTYMHTTLSPFSGVWQNRVDSFLLTNATLLFAGALYFRSTSNELTKGIYSITLLVMAYIVFVVMFLLHFNDKFGAKADRVKDWCARLNPTKRSWSYRLQENSESSSEEETDNNKTVPQQAAPLEISDETPQQHEVAGSVLNVWQHESQDVEEIEIRPTGPRVVSFSEFREPLMDEGEAELSTTFMKFKRRMRPTPKN